MINNIRYPTLRFGKVSIDLFPYWIGLLIAGFLFGLAGAFVVLRDGL